MPSPIFGQSWISWRHCLHPTCPTLCRLSAKHLNASVFQSNRTHPMHQLRAGYQRTFLDLYHVKKTRDALLYNHNNLMSIPNLYSSPPSPSRASLPPASATSSPRGTPFTATPSSAATICGSSCSFSRPWDTPR